MTKGDELQGQALTDRQIKAIPFIVISPTIEEGIKKAHISKNAFYQWLKNPLFKEEIKRQRDAVINEALDTMKGSITRAVTELVKLMDTKNENLRRSVCNDIITYVLKTMELSEFEERLQSIERIVLEHRTYKRKEF